MIKFPIVLLALVLSWHIGDTQDLKLWYQQPAKNWETEALPLGNGRLAAMIFGTFPNEQIQFNEESLWVGDEVKTGAYQAFGNVLVEMDHSHFTNYKRELDIERAVHTVTYECNGIKYRREAFASYPDNVMVFRFSSDKPGKVSGSVTLSDMHEASISSLGNRIIATGSMKNKLFTGYGDEKSYDVYLDYESQVLVLNEGGKVSTIDGKIVFTNTNNITIILDAGTNFIQNRNKGWKAELPHNAITKRIDAAARNSYKTLFTNHLKNYQSLFNRVKLNLGVLSDFPTDIRLKNISANKMRDGNFEALLFQYGRYLLISSSRDGLPANLQGKWNNSNNPPWRSDYHTDINIQMNYWLADPANLSECFLPLAKWLHSIRVPRKNETLHDFKTRGWTMRAENGIFGGSTWEWVESGSAWCMQNVWDHYAFTNDKTYLKSLAYPMMKEVCEFWLDRLKTLSDGSLVAPNGYSPEHGPREDGVSHDQQLIWDLFDNTIKASAALGVDKDFRDSLIIKQSKLLGPKIGKWGQLQEWMVDRDDPEDKHRHMSHLVAVHPGHQISVDKTPQLSEAAKVSLNARGDVSTGWSTAWKINLWARLHDGERAHKILGNLVRLVGDTGYNYQDGGGIYVNLFDAHPPFQIDGNFGYTAGVCEMLLQSHTGVIELLPALPSAWSSGKVSGLKARGGFVVDMEWRDGKIFKYRIASKIPEKVKIRINNEIKEIVSEKL